MCSCCRVATGVPPQASKWYQEIRTPRDAHNQGVRPRWLHRDTQSRMLVDGETRRNGKIDSLAGSLATLPSWAGQPRSIPPSIFEPLPRFDPTACDIFENFLHLLHDTSIDMLIRSRRRTRHTAESQA